VPDLGSYVSINTKANKKSNNHINIIGNLIGVHETTHTILDTENVIVHGVDVCVERTGIGHETSRIDTTEVESTRGLEFARVEAKGVEEMCGNTAIECRERRVVVKSCGRVVRLRNFSVTDVGTIDLKLHLTRSHTNITTLVRREELHGVVVVELLNCGTRRDRLLRLCNEHVLGCGRNSSALVRVEVDELSVNFIIRHRESTPRDAKLYIVVLKRDERKRRLRVLTERETKGVKPRIIGTGSGERLGIRLRKHQRGNLLRELGRVCIDNLTTDEKFDLADLRFPITACRRVRGRAISNVNITEHITLALEANGGHTIRDGVTLDNLLLYGLSKVCVTFVIGSEKGHLGLTDNVSILSANSDELGNTTGHFYIILRFYF
jgi:hypothetical protein